MYPKNKKNQLKQLQDMAKAFSGGASGRFPGMGAPGGGGLCRAPRYAVDYSGLKDKELRRGDTIEKLPAGLSK